MFHNALGSRTPIFLYFVFLCNLYEFWTYNCLFCSFDFFEGVECLIIFNNRSLPKKGSGKRCLRFLINIQRRSHLFDSALVGDDDFICHFNGFILVVCDKDARYTQLFNHFLEPASQLLPYLCVNRCKRFIQ